MAMVGAGAVVPVVMRETLKATRSEQVPKGGRRG
jgi:hypothetical protein